MAITTGGGNLLVDKGEKIGLAVAAVFGIALLALGLKGAFDRPQDPVAFSKGLDDKAAQLKSAMDSKTGEIPGLVGPVTESANSTPIAVRPDPSNFYDPTQPPDSRRITPVILSLIEGQTDIAILKILANDFEFETDADGNVTVTVGVVTAKNPDKKIEKGDVDNFTNRVKTFTKVPRKRKDPQAGGGMVGGPPGAGMLGGPPGGFAGGPGGPGGSAGPGRPGGGSGALGSPPGGENFSPGYGSGSGSGRPPGPGGAGGPGGPGPAGPGAGKDLEVTRINAADDDELDKKLNGGRIALTIKPQKMVVLQSSFPYRAQLEKFRQALRYKTLEDLYRSTDDMPTFHGVDVQRRTYNSKDDLIEDWQSIELAANSRDLRAMKLFYNEDSNDLKRAMLHEDHMLVMPLPHEIAGKYPELRLKTIKETIDKMKKADPKLQVPPPPKTKFGEGNPFKRENAPSAEMYNQGGAGGLFPNMPGRGKESPAATSEGKYEPPDYVFVRVYDTDIKDGLTYEYRMRVKVKNPNFGKKDLVSKASDADNEELPPLEEHWFTFPQKVKVPQAGYFYVVDPTLPNPKVVQQLPTPREGQAVVQFQAWIDKLFISESFKEPIGDWVQSELLATRGQFVFGKAFAPVPFWSPTENTFVVKPVIGDKIVKGKEPRMGWILDPVKPRFLLAVDVVGGKPTTKAAKIDPNLGEKPNRFGLIDDNAAAEILFLMPDGTLEVHSSARDKADPDRKLREENFKKWADEAAGKNTAAPAKKKEEF